MGSNNEYEQQQFWLDNQFTIRTYENGAILFGNKEWWKQLEEIGKFKDQQEFNLMFNINGK